MRRLVACGCCPAEVDVYECDCCESTYYSEDCYEVDVDGELVIYCSSCVDFVE